jgi:hypothetical protein
MPTDLITTPLRYPKYVTSQYTVRELILDVIYLTTIINYHSADLTKGVT